MGDSKKKYRIEGVAPDSTLPSDTAIKKYAETIEETMNRLHGEGYETTLFEQGEGAGMLIIGKLPLEQQASPLSRLARALGAIPVVLGGSQDVEDGPMNQLSKRTSELVAKFVRACPSLEPKGFEVEVRRVASEMVKGFTGNELITATAEIVKEAAEHEKGHKPDSDCELPALLRVLATVITETAQAQLQ